MSALASFKKDPNAKLPYTQDWSQWLEPGDTITAVTATASPGLTVVSATFNATSVTAVVEGGQAGITYEVAYEVFTGLGYIDQRTFDFQVTDR